MWFGGLPTAVTRSRLLLAVAAVLAGATALFVVLGVVFNLVLVAAAVPFGLAAYLLWLHATGRLAARVRRRSPPRDYRERPGGGAWSTRGDADERQQPGDWPPADGPSPSMDRLEALRVLDLKPGADQPAIRQAYREQVKAVHPDAEGGDEDAFRRVTAAYQRLRRR